MQLLRHLLRITWHAYDLFVEDDGWAIASHIALSMLMTLFPFLIVVMTESFYTSSSSICKH